MVEKKKKNGGFTLVELIVAVTLFAIVIGPLFQAFSSSIKANSRARGVLKATQLAESIMDNVERYTQKTLRDDMPLADLKTNILPKGITFTSSPIRDTSNTDDTLLEFKGAVYQDLPVNIKVSITKRASENPNTTNKYFMYTVDVYVHMNKGVTPAAAFSNEPLAHLRGSVQNIE